MYDALILAEFEREYSEFQDSALYLTGQKERVARLGFAHKIESMLSLYPDNADLYHKLGLCLYDLSHWEEEDKNSIEIAFHRALLLDLDSVFSRLFLTFFYFDIGKYHLSLQCSEALLSDVSERNILRWRMVKLNQIRLSSLIVLDALEQNKLERELRKLLDEYSKLDEDELIAAEPVELNKILTESKYSRDKNIVEYLKILQNMITSGI